MCVVAFSFFLPSAMAVYVLVTDWTASRPAGMVAALLYAFGAAHG